MIKTILTFERLNAHFSKLLPKRMQSNVRTTTIGHYTVTHNTQTDYITFTPKDVEHKYSLIWLHGLGDSANGFRDVFADSRLGVVPPSCKVVIPTAPIRAVTCNGGMRMTSWYDILTMDRPSTMGVDEARQLVGQDEIRDSVRIVTDLVKDEVASLNGDHKKVFIGGFSQGCAISLATFMLYKDGELGGCVGLSGAHSVALDYANEVDLELKRKTKVFLYHGEDDPVIDVVSAHKSYEEFATHQLDYTFEKEPGLEHSLSMPEIKKVGQFFNSLMI